MRMPLRPITPQSIAAMMGASISDSAHAVDSMPLALP